MQKFRMRNINDVGSGLDWLAVSAGSIHQLTSTDKAPIDFDALRGIELVCRAPLVSHGASGISAEDIQLLKKDACCKNKCRLSIAPNIGTIAPPGV